MSYLSIGEAAALLGGAAGNRTNVTSHRPKVAAQDQSAQFPRA